MVYSEFPADQPFPCPSCRHVQADALSRTYCYVTDIDAKTQARSARLSQTIYQLKCPQCHNEFSVTVPA